MKYSLIIREPLSDIAFSDINGVRYYMPSIFEQFEKNGWCLDNEQERRVLSKKEKIYNIKLTNGRDLLFVDLTNPLNLEQDISKCCVVALRVFNDPQNNVFTCRIVGGIELGKSKCRDVQNVIGTPKELDIHYSHHMGLYIKIFKYVYFGYIVSLYFEGDSDTDYTLISINTYCSNEITVAINSDGHCEYSGYGIRIDTMHGIAEEQIEQFNIAWQNQTNRDIAIYAKDRQYIRTIIRNLNNSYYENIDSYCLTLFSDFDSESRNTLKRFIIDSVPAIPFRRFNISANRFSEEYQQMVKSLDRGERFICMSKHDEEVLVSLIDESGKDQGILVGKKTEHIIAFKYAHTFSTISRYRLNINRTLLENLIASDLDLRNTKATHINMSGLPGVVFYDNQKEYFTPLSEGLFGTTSHRVMTRSVLYTIKDILELQLQSIE